MKELLVGIPILVIGLYLLFCMYLTCISLPNENGRARYEFREEPTGFWKFSRKLGYVIMVLIIASIVLAIAYTIGISVLR